VRVIGEGGKQVGVVTIKKALELANKAKLDLVEIAPKAKPPVAKITEFGKFKYEQEKKLRKEKKRSKPLDLKEVRLSPFIGEHDFNTRFERIKEFLQEKHKVRVVVKFKGRQMGSKKFGYDLMKKVLGKVDGKITVDMEPKFIGRHLTMVISPTTGGVKNEQKSKKETKK
jgi:translation initiation factor IF-3